MKRHRRRRPRQPGRRRLVPVVLVTLLFVVLVTLGMGMWVEQREQESELSRRTVELNRQLEDMQKEARRLQEIEAQVGSLEYIEKIAREELGMGLENEKRFVDEP